MGHYSSCYDEDEKRERNRRRSRADALIRRIELVRADLSSREGKTKDKLKEAEMWLREEGY